MRPIEEIIAALAAATNDQERSALITELTQARAAADANPLVQLRSRLAEVETRRTGLTDQFEQITTNAVDDTGDARGFTAEEGEQRGRLLAQIDQARAEHAEVEDRLRQVEQDDREKRMQDQVAQMRRDLGLGDQSTALSGITDINERRTYEKGNGVSFLKDSTFRAFGPGIGGEYARACERLGRHAHENHVEALELDAKAIRSESEEYFRRQMIEQRVCGSPFSDRESLAQGLVTRGATPGLLSYRALSTASTAGGEFVPPMYLTEEWIAFLRAGRVVANCMHHEDLPDGTMSLNIPKVTAGTSVAAQGTQNTLVSMTDLQTAYVTIPVVTFAGQQIVSLQLLERSPISFDQIVMADLGKAHAQYVDQQVINGTGAGGQVTGILNTSGITAVTWSTGTTNVKGLYGQIGLAKKSVATSIFLPATHGFMTPNVWEWVGQSFDTQNRPLVVPEYGGPFNAITVGDDPTTAEGAVGRGLSGLRAFEDNNIPVISTDEVVLVARAQENYLYESPVVTRALPQTYGAQMSVLLQLYNYGAFTAARYPTANAAITGSQLASSALTYNNGS